MLLACASYLRRLQDHRAVHLTGPEYTQQTAADTTGVQLFYLCTVWRQLGGVFHNLSSPGHRRGARSQRMVTTVKWIISAKLNSQIPSFSQQSTSIHCSLLMPDMNANITANKQWKQWLNRVTDWNNSSFCPLVSRTSCLTKLNPSWCQAFRPISPLFCLVVFFNLSLLSFCLDPDPLIGSLGTDIKYLFFVMYKGTRGKGRAGETECKDKDGDGQRAEW